MQPNCSPACIRLLHEVNSNFFSLSVTQICSYAMVVEGLIVKDALETQKSVVSTLLRSVVGAGAYTLNV